MRSTVEPPIPAAQVQPMGHCWTSAVATPVSTLTHVSGVVKERQALRFQVQGLPQVGAKAFVALRTRHRPPPLELGELQQATMPPYGRLRLLSVAGGGEGDHQAIKIDTITQRRLLDGMLFIYGAGTAAAEVELGQDVADMGINRDRLSDLHGGFKERATRLPPQHTAERL